MSFRILHTEWSKGWGGQEIRILTESEAFLKKGYQIYIACQPDSTLMLKTEEAKIPTIPIVFRRKIDPAAILACMKVLREKKIDLVHTHSGIDSWNCGIAARLSGIPVVRSRHLSTPIHKNLFSYFLYMKIADLVITSGKTIRETMIQINHMIPEKIVSIPAGVDIRRFSPLVDRSPVDREFGLSEGDFIVGIVAVLRGWKGHEYLIRAVQELIGTIPRMKLIIVGSGPQEKNLKILIQKEGLENVVLMAGYREAVPAFIRAMNCLVLPSIGNEATSQVLPQAMAMQIPVIATDAGGLSEVVIHQNSGLLVPPRNSTALKEAIEWIYRNPDEAKKMADRGYERCLTYFTFDKMIHDTEQVYLRLLKI